MTSPLLLPVSQGNKAWPYFPQRKGGTEGIPMGEEAPGPADPILGLTVDC